MLTILTPRLRLGLVWGGSWAGYHSFKVRQGYLERPFLQTAMAVKKNEKRRVEKYSKQKGQFRYRNDFEINT